MKNIVKITMATFVVTLIVFNVLSVKENAGNGMSLSLYGATTTAKAQTEDPEIKQCFCDYWWLYDSCEAGNNSTSMCASGPGTIRCANNDEDC